MKNEQQHQQPTSKKKTQQTQATTKPTKRKQQQQEAEGTNKQPKITRFAKLQENNQEEQTRQQSEQQQTKTETQQTNTEPQKTQQQQQQPKMTIGTKGIVISDLKKFLEEKKLARAARVKEKQKHVKPAESHTRLKNLPVDSAHRARLGGISGPDDQPREKTGATSGN